VLGYREALSIVGRMASSALGRAAVEGLSPSTDPGWIADELALVTEMSGLLRRDDGWGLPAIPDLHDAIRRLRVDGSVLEGEELRAASVLLSSSHTVRRSLLGQREQLPRLAAEAEPLADLPSVVAAIDRAIDENGEVKDDASPELARL